MDSRSSKHRSSHHSSSRSSRRHSGDRSSSRHSSERTESPEPRGDKRSRDEYQRESRRRYDHRHHRRYSRDEKREREDERRSKSSRYDDERSSRHYRDRDRDRDHDRGRDRDRHSSRSSYTSRDKRRESSRSKHNEVKPPLPKIEAAPSTSLPEQAQSSSEPPSAPAAAYYPQQSQNWGYYGDQSWAGYPPGSEQQYYAAYYGQQSQHAMDASNTSTESYYHHYAQYYSHIPPPPHGASSQQPQPSADTTVPATLATETEDDNMAISPPPARSNTTTGVPESVLDVVGYPTQTSDDPAILFEKIGQVGEGTYGKVYKARNSKTGHLMALKRIRMKSERDGFPITAMREIKLLQKLKHERIVELQQIMVANGSLYMVLEYMDHDLSGILGHPKFKFEPAHAKSLTKQMLEGLAYLHHMGILHRDIKGSNLLLSNKGELKIADFGLARVFQKNRAHDYTNRVITLWYRPPELLLGATAYGPAVDIWSVGCIMLEFFAGKPSFRGDNEITQLEMIYKIMGTPDAETWPSVAELPWYALIRPKEKQVNRFKETFESMLSSGALALAEALLSMDPQNRPTAANALKFDYFTSEEPAPAMPANLLNNVNGDWHEFESKQRKQQNKAQQKQQQQRAAAAPPQRSQSRTTHYSSGVNDRKSDKSLESAPLSHPISTSPTSASERLPAAQ